MTNIKVRALFVLLGAMIYVPSIAQAETKTKHIDHHLDASIRSDFSPAFYDHKAMYRLAADPDTVFPFFEPQWRRLWRPSWKQ